MRIRLLVASGAAVALAFPFTANAGSPPAPYLITGGGQVLGSSDPSSQAGPGDTIAFVAGLDDSDGVFGSLQVVKTSEARAGQRPTIIFNGRVTCVERGGTDDTARFGGTGRAPDGTSFPFVVDVVDSGDDSRGTDMVTFRESENPAEPCEDDENGTLLNGTTLARGNLTIDTANSSGRE